MDRNARAQYYPAQDSLAAEMLNKLQDASGYTMVAVPEGYALHTPSNASLVSGTTSVLNSSLIASSLSQSSISGDGTILSSASGLDPALTQLLVEAGTNHQTAASSLISDIPPSLTSCMSVTLPSDTVHNLHSALSATLSTTPSQEPTSVLLPADPTPQNPPPVPSAEAMTITVQCTLFDTVIVVGQQNWQCCMCRDIHGFDASIDQHLALKHNLHPTPLGQQESRLAPGGNPNTATAVLPQSQDSTFAENKAVLPSTQPLQTISEQALASLKSTDPGNSRSGLEREVALLMAQTFTHSGDASVVNEGVNKGDSFSMSSAISREPKDVVLSSDCTYADSIDANSRKGLHPEAKDKEAGAMNVFGKMINKVERAILSTSDLDTKNDLLLVATELARMRKDMTSKRSKMRRTHRYISCPECGKEVRNRKDLIKQHNRCHEKTKKYRCLICNKLFKYIHTLRRHVTQQGHKGGMPSDMAATPKLDDDNSMTSVSETTNTVQLVKTESEEAEVEDIEQHMTNSFSPLSAESKEASSESKVDKRPSTGQPAYEKILAMLLSKGEQNRTPSGRKLSLLQCFVCDREIRNRKYYITRHARCHMEDLCYSCSICGMEFYRRDYYKDHMMQHGDSSSQGETSENAVPISKGQGSKEKQGKNSGPWHDRKKAWTPKPPTVPCKICGKGIFNRTYNIKRHAQQHSILEWESILSSSQDLPFNKPQSKALASSQRHIHCGVCGMSFKNYTLKRRHMLKHRFSFSCRLCHSKFDSGAELMAHAQTCKKSGGATSGAGDQEQGQHAGSENARGPTWKKQLTGQASSVKKFMCPVCNASIIHTMQNIKRHMRELHSDGQPHTCSTCSRTYDSYHKLQRHLKSHGDTGGICHVCGKVFRTKSALRSHTKLHASPEGMFQCPQCPKSFRFQGRLEKHVRKHAEHADICPHCGKVYISKIHLQRHISVVHLGVKDYRHKCNQCGAQFFESVQLRDHIAYRHHRIQLYTCKYCNKGFNCRPTMIRHERKEHTNYLPYKCKHCAQCFPEKSKLVAHEMTHTGMSPHKCDICGKYFTTGSALKAHKNLHMGVKPFVCAGCGKTYLKNWHLQQHIRKAHRTVEVMVYKLIHSPPGQEAAQQPINQQNILPSMDQPCQQSADVKSLHVPVQGEYIQVQAAEGSNLQQTTDLQHTAQNMMQGHGQIPMQHTIAYR